MRLRASGRAALLRAANPAQILDRRPLYAYLRLLGSATAVALLCGVLFGDDLAQAAQRCAHPLTAYERPPRTLITVRPGNLEIIKGDDATLQVHFAGDKPRRARIVRRPSAEAPYQTEELVVDRADSVTYTFPQVQRSFHYAIAVGDDRSPEYEVRVIDPPAVKRLRLHYQYPAYSRLPDRIEEEGGDIQGLPGTRVALEVTANKPLSKAALVLDDTLSLAPQLDGATARIALQIERPGSYHIDLVDRKGATNRDPIRYAIQVREDQKPVVAITDPGRDSDLCPSPSRCYSRPRPATTFPSRKSPWSIESTTVPNSASPYPSTPNARYSSATSGTYQPLTSCPKTASTTT